MDQFEAAYESYKARQTTVDQENVPSGKEEIIAVRRNEEDNIIAVKTNTGRELDLDGGINNENCFDRA